MRGGKRDGAGRKPRVLRYHKTNERTRIGRRALKIGQRCETIRRETKKPHKVILFEVATEFDERESMVERLWKDYRRLERHLKADLG